MSQIKQQPIEQPEEIKGRTQVEEVSSRIQELELELAEAKAAQLRAIADYQNLQRRSKDELSRTVKFATNALVQDLLEPLEHLSMTGEQLKSPIFDMVMAKLWNVLEDHGLKELAVLGNKFDIQTMEVVEILDGVDEEVGVVVKVVKRGYSLNEQVIQHAKVVLGKK